MLRFLLIKENRDKISLADLAEDKCLFLSDGKFPDFDCLTFQLCRLLYAIGLSINCIAGRNHPRAIDSSMGNPFNLSLCLSCIFYKFSPSACTIDAKDEKDGRKRKKK